MHITIVVVCERAIPFGIPVLPLEGSTIAISFEGSLTGFGSIGAQLSGKIDENPNTFSLSDWNENVEIKKYFKKKEILLLCPAKSAVCLRSIHLVFSAYRPTVIDCTVSIEACTMISCSEAQLEKKCSGYTYLVYGLMNRQNLHVFRCLSNGAMGAFRRIAAKATAELRWLFSLRRTTISPAVIPSLVKPAPIR